MCVCVNFQIVVMLLRWWIHHRSGLPKMSVVWPQKALYCLHEWKANRPKNSFCVKYHVKIQQFIFICFPCSFMLHGWSVSVFIISFSKEKIYAYSIYILCYYIQRCFISLFFLRCLRRIDSRQILVRIAFCTFISCRIKSWADSNFIISMREGRRVVREGEIGGDRLSHKSFLLLLTSGTHDNDTTAVSTCLSPRERRW